MCSALTNVKVKIGLRSVSGSARELQNMLGDGNNSKDGAQGSDNHDTCLISESPYRILRVSKLIFSR